MTVAQPFAVDPAAPLAGPAYSLTVVIPTYNERDNVVPLIERLRRVLAGAAWQAIFVDDNSPDGTAEAVKTIAASDPRIECIRRIGRRGLAGAVIEGIMASAAPFVAVIDADLQHDERLLPAMLEALRSDRAELVIGSRYVEAPHVGHGLSPLRGLASRLAAALARIVLKARVTDPVSGFFMIRRELVEAVAPRLSSHGFKILFDIIASQPRPLRLLELPYDFAERRSGQSKLDLRVVVEYFGLLVARLTGNLIPPRALLFVLVGASGLVVQLAVMRLALTAGLAFDVALIVAGVTAMSSNYLVNNAVTWRDRRLVGWAFARGYLRFCGLCGIPLIVNFAVAHLVWQHTAIWWLAGVAGAIFGAVWNYVSTSLAVW
ncbi:MAG: glycosyltransferase family 2 protein [Caulobacteraceae bacterium]